MAHIATTREMQACNALGSNFSGFLYTVRMAMLRRQELEKAIFARPNDDEDEAENRRLEKIRKEDPERWVHETLDDDGAGYPSLTEEDFLYPDQTPENED